MSESEIVQILLVEDTPEDLELTLRALRKTNLINRIEVARDGAEAIDFIFCEGAHVGRKMEDGPKLILLDLKLPKIDGLEVLREVKASPSCGSVPVIVLTSSGEQRDIAESYRLGVNSYVQKPVDIAEFRSAIKALALYWLNVNRSPFSRDQRRVPPFSPPASFE